MDPWREPRERCIICRMLRGLLASALLCSIAGCGGADDGPPTPSGATGVLVVRGIDPEDGATPACKATLRARGETAPIVWHDPADVEGHVGRWAAGDVLLVDDTALATRCDMELDVPVGEYELTVSAGPEREAVERDVTIASGETTTADVELPRAVDSAGWACGDLHVHSAPSVDSDVPLDQRVVSAVAEGLDLMAATDHDALGEWAPALEETGLDGSLVVLPGNEISPGVVSPGIEAREFKGHFNVYPVPEDIVLPRDMPHVGLTVDQILAGARSAAPGAVLQVNHPRWDQWIGYFDTIDFDPATATARDGMLAMDFDALEVWNGHELDLGDARPPIEETLADWIALLRVGRVVVATGNSDTHRLARSPVGFPRTCVRVADDGPGRLEPTDFVEGLRVGNAFVTSGPFLDVVVGEGGLGATVVPDPDGVVTVAVHVQAPAWVPVDRVTLLVDGEAAMDLEVDELPTTVGARLRADDADAFLVVVAQGDAPLGVPAGNPAVPMQSLAFTNPVWIDADGDGLWTPPGP